MGMSNMSFDHDEPTELDLVYEMLHKVEAERNDLRTFAEWVETWISSPVGAFSVHALDGLFGMTRDRLAALREKRGEGVKTDE